MSAVGSAGAFDVDPALADLLTPILRDVNLPESSWPRVAQVIDLLNQQRPFQPAVVAGTTSAVAVEEPPAAPTRRPLTPREHHDVIRKRLTLASGWWAQFAAKQGRQPVAHFLGEIYRRTGIKKLDDATPDQLSRAVQMALSQIQDYCRDANIQLPKWFRAF